jgi:hypothetical protein
MYGALLKTLHSVGKESLSEIHSHMYLLYPRTGHEPITETPFNPLGMENINDHIRHINIRGYQA